MGGNGDCAFRCQIPQPKPDASLLSGTTALLRNQQVLSNIALVSTTESYPKVTLFVTLGSVRAEFYSSNILRGPMPKNISFFLPELPRFPPLPKGQGGRLRAMPLLQKVR